jgi:hypothetical protein
MERFSLKISQGGVYGPIGSGDGQARATLHAHPVLMGEDRTGSKKILINWAACSLHRLEIIVDFNPCPIDRVPLWI